MPEESPWKLRLRLASVIAAVLAILVVLATFGMALPPSPWVPVVFQEPTAADSNGTITAIVDSASQRVLILNSNDELTGIINCARLNSPLEKATDVCVSGDTVYVAGVVYESDSDVIKRERIVAYDSHGRSEQIVYNLDDQQSLLHSIKTMDNAPDGIYAARLPEADDRDTAVPIEVLHVTRAGWEKENDGALSATTAFDMGYNHETEECTVLDTTGRLAHVLGGRLKEISATRHIYTSLSISDDGLTYVVDDTQDTVSLMNFNDPDDALPVLTDKNYDNLHINGQHITASVPGTDEVLVCSLDGKEQKFLRSASLSDAMTSVTGVVALCRIYLVLFGIIALALKLKDAFKEGLTENLGPALAAVVAVGLVALAIGYTSLGSYNAMMAAREKEINVFADYLELIGSGLFEDMQNCNDRELFVNESKQTEEHIESYYSLSQMAGGLAEMATRNGVGTYTAIYGQDDKGVFCLYDATGNHIFGSSLDSSVANDDIQQVFDTGKVSNKISYVKTRDSTTMRRLVTIRSSDETQVLGVIEVGCHLSSFEKSLKNSHAERIIALLVIMLVVFLTYVELRACLRCFLSFRQMRHHRDAIAILTRPFSFLVTLLSSIDAVMTALIARSLIESTGSGQSSPLIALPAVMLGIGLALGQQIYSLLGSRVVIRRLMTRGAIAMVCAAVFAAFAVWDKSFWLYCLAKLLMAIPFGLLYTLTYSLPRRADSDEVRALAAAGIKRTDTSAAALGTVLGGYAAQTFGHVGVYALVAAVGTFVLFMAWRVLPQSNTPLEEKVTMKSHREAVMKLLSSRNTLAIIFFLMLPAILASGYNSFLFPLFSANLGLATSSINNLFVVGQLVVFLSIPTLERLEARYDKWRVGAVSIALLAVVFLLFSFNTTLAWAVATIALVGMLCKAADAWKALWPRSAEAIGLTTGLATGVMFSVRSVLLIVQPLVLGALLSVSDSQAVVTLGIVCAVCAPLFYFTTRHSALRPPDQEQDTASDQAPESTPELSQG